MRNYHAYLESISHNKLQKRKNRSNFFKIFNKINNLGISNPHLKQKKSNSKSKSKSKSKNTSSKSRDHTFEGGNSQLKNYSDKNTNINSASKGKNFV